MIAPDPIAFTLFGLDVRWYGLLIGIGFLLAALIAMKRAPLHGLTSDFVIDELIVVIPSAIIGARAYYVLFRWDEYAGNLKAILNVRGGGLAVHGGIILCVISVFVFCKLKKTKFLPVTDLCFTVIPLGQAIGRWGNFFNEEAHGTVTDLPWAQIIDGVGYHPTFLYESIWCFLLFLFLLWFDSKKRSADGQTMALYMILYSVERFFVEGLRTDSLMIGTLRQAQVISICILVAGVILFAFVTHMHKKTTETL